MTTYDKYLFLNTGFTSVNTYINLSYLYIKWYLIIDKTIGRALDADQRLLSRILSFQSGHESEN